MLDILTHGEWPYADLDVVAVCPGARSRHYESERALLRAQFESDRAQKDAGHSLAHNHESLGRLDPPCRTLCHVRRRVLALLAEVSNADVDAKTRELERAQCVPGIEGDKREARYTLDYKGHQGIGYAMFPAHNSKAKCQDADDAGRCLNTGPRYGMPAEEYSEASRTWTWQPVIDFCTVFDYDSTLAYVDGTVDFDFTAVIYDGERLRVRNWDSIWLRHATCDVSRLRYRPGNVWSGWGIDADIHTPATMSQRAHLRAAKYRERGFSTEVLASLSDDEGDLQSSEEDWAYEEREHGVCADTEEDGNSDENYG